MLRLGCVFALLLSLPASAQSVNCDKRDRVVAKLTLLGEVQSGLGLSKGGQVFEIWTSATSGTWTIVLSHSNGLSCIMSYGNNWIGVEEAGLQGKPT